MEAQADFLVVGGWAVILYGHVRSTDDPDVFVRPSKANSQRVFAALNAYGAPLHAQSVVPEYFATEGAAYRFGIAPLKIEVLTKISGVVFDEALQGAQTFDLDGYQVPYIGKVALIANKKSAARHKGSQKTPRKHGRHARRA